MSPASHFRDVDRVFTPAFSAPLAFDIDQSPARTEAHPAACIPVATRFQRARLESKRQTVAVLDEDLAAVLANLHEHGGDIGFAQPPKRRTRASRLNIRPCPQDTPPRLVVAS
jgi:hypothetical protein